MSEDKKDLTRIEDLGEYLHELNQGPDTELPDLPMEEVPDFNLTETLEDTSPFVEEEIPSFPENDFESSEDFAATDFGTEDFTSENTEVLPTDTATSFELSEDEIVEEEAVAEEVEAFSSLEEPEFLEGPISDPEPIELEVAPASAEYQDPENFTDVKKFAESSSFTGMGAEGNPSFTVLIKNVRYLEDVNDILAMLKELGLMSDSEEQMKSRLSRGNLLVPRISEYAAIFLAHKLRRFDIDIQVGLSDEIHPPKHQELPETGVVSKFNLYQNQSHHFHFDDPKVELSQIVVSATPGLEGHQVIRYIGIASEHKMLDSHVVEDEDSTEIPRHYTELAQKLKAHALKSHANAVVGLNYQLTPMPSDLGHSTHKYRLTCTGNLVWVNRL